MLRACYNVVNMTLSSCLTHTLAHTHTVAQKQEDKICIDNVFQIDDALQEGMRRCSCWRCRQAGEERKRCVCAGSYAMGARWQPEGGTL